MQHVAALEATSSHPLASALTAYHGSSLGGGCAAAARGRVPDLPPATEVMVLPGRGITGTVNGAAVAVGNQQLMIDIGIALPQAGVWERWAADAKTVVFATIDQQLELVLALTDQLKPDAMETIRTLHGIGVTVTVLTGDNKVCAAAVTAAVGALDFEAELRPEQKRQWIVERQQMNRVVGMVGDGINDGLALSQADVGIAMGARGTALAAQAADVILLSDCLSLLPPVIALARRCRRVVRINVGVAFTIKGVMLLTNFIIPLPLWTAIVADMAALAIVLLSGLTLLAPIQGADGDATASRHYNVDALLEAGAADGEKEMAAV